MAVLPISFGKSIIYQSFVLAKTFGDSHSFASIVIIVPPRSIIPRIIEDQPQFGLKAVALGKNQQLLKDIADNRFQVIFSSANQALPLVLILTFIVHTQHKYVTSVSFGFLPPPPWLTHFFGIVSLI